MEIMAITKNIHDYDNTYEDNNDENNNWKHVYLHLAWQQVL